MKGYTASNLVWTTIDQSYCDYILPEAFEYCNLGFIIEPNSRERIYRKIPKDSLERDYKDLIFNFHVNFEPINLKHVVETGTYKIVIKIGADNLTNSVTKRYRLTINNDWDESEKKMLEDGIELEEL